MNYPTHIAIIPDGCRRWAVRKKKSPWAGHKKGIERLEDIGKWSFGALPIKYYTIYGLSLENLNRSRVQLKALEKLYIRHFLRLAEDESIHKNQVRVGTIGRTDLLPRKLLDAIDVAKKATTKYDKIFFNIALAYSGRAEIVDAVNKLQGAGKKVTEKSISKNLYSNAPDPDLLIRTGEERISNFLLWGSAYTEVYFSKKLWPDFTKEDYKKVMLDFDKRKRRFGE